MNPGELRDRLSDAVTTWSTSTQEHRVDVDAVLPVSVIGTIGVRLSALAANDSVKDPRNWREPFAHLAEILAIPGRFSMTTRIAAVRADSGDTEFVSDLVITCFGDVEEDVAEELVQVAEQVYAHLAGKDRPFWIDFLRLDALRWPAHARSALLVRQRSAEVRVEDDLIEVPLRFTNPGPGAASRLLQTIRAFGPGTEVLVSVTPTRLRAHEEHHLHELSTTTSQAWRPAAADGHRAVATAIDLGASMRTQTFALQLLIVSQRPMGEAVRQAIGSAFTSAFDTERLNGARVVARPNAFIGGGFEIEPVRDPDRWLARLGVGLPLIGTSSDRTLRDLISSTELEYVFGWIGDQQGHLPGVPMTNSTASTVPADSTTVDIGLDPMGNPVRIGGMDRHLHMVIMGGTGSGKTTCMADLARQDIEAGRTVIVVDPHGDLLYRVADLVPFERRHDVVMLDGCGPSAESLQFLRTFPPDSPEQDLVEEAIIEGVTTDMNADFSGPVFMRVMRGALRAARLNGKTISDIPATFAEGFVPRLAGYRVEDPASTAHFRELASWSDKYRAEVLTWATSKFNAFQTDSIRSTFDAPQGESLASILETNPVLLVRPAESGTSARTVMGMFIGALLVCLRHRTPSDETTSLVLDEAHLYNGGMMRRVMNESRKRAMAVHAATQSMTNLGSQFEAFAGNAGTIVTGRCSSATAAFASGLLEVPTRLIERLPNLTFLVRTTSNGAPRAAIACRVQPPASVPSQWPEWLVL